ncbi:MULTISPECIES: hypothetical protein [unclassified Leifsonia]|uniref:hypothetical protein n=1 Tax=unclassified Leifsonia TaxID=2663824 RepID=UPI0008A8112B|nr:MULTISPECIES: hypothetical protein [unclassified Leifsonia]SEH91271.1 hypothetical protein SAMN04515694_106123 [Leifsonia sp. CL154]SFL52641.1 hypothetical protein SAMN04515692_10667 [Leifsonia sp. CL147]
MRTLSYDGADGFDVDDRVLAHLPAVIQAKRLVLEDELRAEIRGEVPPGSHLAGTAKNVKRAEGR